MAHLDELLDRMEALLADVEELDPDARMKVFELLDGVDALHRAALARLGEIMSPDMLEHLRADPAVAWMLDAYSVGVDERTAAESALESVRPYIHSHGGRVEVLGVEEGVVQVRLSGACAGCTASAVTLQEGIDTALREGFPGFRALAVEEDDAPAHPPPGPTLLQIGMAPGDGAPPGR